MNDSKELGRKRAIEISRFILSFNNGYISGDYLFPLVLIQIGIIVNSDNTPKEIKIEYFNKLIKDLQNARDKL